MSIFITGTDTGVGKTITSGYLLKKYIKTIPSLKYWKPIQTGYPSDDDSKTVQNISQVGSTSILNGLKFREPVSPHFAAEQESKSISTETLTSQFYEYNQKYPLLIEGAGGILVPINRKFLWIDWIQEIQVPVLIIARSTLGTINHSLLTIEILKQRKIPIIGIIFCGEYHLPYIIDNRKTIQDFGKIPVISYFNIDTDPQIDPDPYERLKPYL